MKLKEVRIGNFVDLFGSVASVCTSYFDVKYSGIAIKSGIPISLTHEWLLSFGFEYNEFELHYKKDNFYLHKESKNGKNVFFDSNLDFQIKHVHQLQNLFFDLTKRELVKK